MLYHPPGPCAIEALHAGCGSPRARSPARNGVSGKEGMVCESTFINLMGPCAIEALHAGCGSPRARSPARNGMSGKEWTVMNLNVCVCVWVGGWVCD